MIGIQTFIKYDFGPLGNLKKYGQLKTPVYDLKKVTTQVNIFYGLNDFLIAPKVKNQKHNFYVSLNFVNFS